MSAAATDSAQANAASKQQPHRKPQLPPPSQHRPAWTGLNPITSRTSSHLPNGTDKPLPKLPSAAAAAKGAESSADKHAHDRLLYLVANLTGLAATVTLKNGEQFSGVFSGGVFESAAKSQYVLKMVQRKQRPGHPQANGMADAVSEYVGDGDDHVMSFDVQDTADLAVADVATAAAARPAPNGSLTSSFRTDAEISSRRDTSTPREHELQPWDAGDADPSLDLSLGDAGTSGNLSLDDRGAAGWDQFAANERMYGVQTDYDESIYTTAINRSHPRYKQQEAEAERIAREIERAGTSDAHVAEERRVNADADDGLDEEEKYSGVQRESAVPLPKRGTGSYVPPSQRPITGAPTVPGAPFDPAIISSQLAKPARAPAVASAVPAAAAAPAGEKAAEPTPTTRDTAALDQSNSLSAENAPTSQVASVGTASAQPTPKKLPEDHMRNVADAFKQFSSHEKFKVKQAQEQKRVNHQKEKNLRFNELKKFSANFKLNSRVPDDLVAILAKDREKQLEIKLKAEEAAKEHELHAQDRKKSDATAESPATPSVGGKNEAAAGTLTTPEQRVAAFNQHNNRQKQSQHGRPPQGNQGQSPRGSLPQRLPPSGPMFARNGTQQGADIRIPTGPAAAAPSPGDRAPLSPASAASGRLNVNAFEFRPAASAFTPSGTSPSPQRSVSSRAPRKASTTETSFFGKNKTLVDVKDRQDIDNAFNPVKRMMEEKHPEEHKKAIAANGGIPKPWFTPPTWDTPPDNAHVSFRDAFPKLPAAGSSQGPSPMHTPHPPGAPGQMPHAHQLPVHLQTPQMGTPNQRSPYYPQPGQHGQQHFVPPMQQFGPNNSVHSSPRFPPAQMAPFNNQMPAHMPGMPQFAGQPMPPYGVSPNMAYRQPQMPMAGPMMMPPQQPGQMAHMRPGFQQGPQMMPQIGGQMMVPNPSGGVYMGGPGMPQQPYSPMPPHAQPVGNFGHMQAGHGTPAGYSASPRPPIMQHSGSHQGFQPPMPGHMPGPQFTGSPGQPHPMHYQRQMSGQGYPQMTPRTQQAQVAPQHPSPSTGQGDEGK